MKRNAAHRAAVLQARFGRKAPRPAPRGLDAEQIKLVSLYHHVNVDAIASGTAEPQMLWDYVGGVLTWWKVSRLMGLGEPEMDVQLDVATRLADRFGKHRRLLFTGPDLQLARDGVVVMDLLAQQVDLATAAAAAVWSTQEVNCMTQAALQMHAAAAAAEQEAA